MHKKHVQVESSHYLTYSPPHTHTYSPLHTHTSLGHHQLECAQLSIRVRELTELLEARGCELETAHEEEVEGVREKWREEVTALNKEMKQTEKK